jgi:prefoldin subunit 1
MESQAKLQEVSRSLSQVRQQASSNARETRVAQLCNKELGALDGNTVTYRAIGKMYNVSILIVVCRFMQESLGDLIGELNDQIKRKESENIGLERASKKMERDIKEGEQMLKEILARRQQQ